jgi:hypothetical protein
MAASQLEAQVWFRCPDADMLYRFACWMAENWPSVHDGLPEKPENHRRFFITNWSFEGDGEPWEGTFRHGLNQAASVVWLARAAGHEVVLYGIHVQPVGGNSPPTTQFPSTTQAAYDDAKANDA